MIIHLDNFFYTEKVYWDELESLLLRFERSEQKTITFDDIQRISYLYKRVVSCLSKVRTFSVEKDKIEKLNSLVARSYCLLHGYEQKQKFSVFDYLFIKLPKSFMRQMKYFIVTLTITFFGFLLGAGIILFDYESKPYLVPFDHLMQTPDERVKGEKKAMGDNIRGHETEFSAYLMTHNIKVSLVAIALGLTFGVGTIVLLFYNGLILGAVVTDYIVGGQAMFMLGWLLPHGVVEIPAIFLAGQVGFLLAHAQIQNLKGQSNSSVRTIYKADIVNLIVCISLMLIWAGIVEAFLSQYHEPLITYKTKIMIGLIELLVLVLFLSGILGRFFIKVFRK